MSPGGRRVGWIVFGALIAGEIPAAWSTVSQEVRFLTERRQVRPAAPVPAGRWLLVAEDDALAGAAAPDFSDVRFINDAGEIIPVATIPARRVDERADLRLAVPLDWRDDGERGWTATVDLGVDSVEQVALEARGGAAPPATSVETSADQTRWLPLRPMRNVGATIPPVPPFPRGPGRFERAERWIRMTVPRGGPGPSLPDSLRVYRCWEQAALPESVAIQSGKGRFLGRTWEETVRLRGPAAAVAAVAVRVPAVGSGPPPYRPQVEVRLPQGTWARVKATWNKADDGGIVSDWSLDFEPVRGTAIRLHVPNADPPNAPFDVVSVTVVRRRWAIPPPVPPRVWIAYGDRQLSPRWWDIGDPTRSGPEPIRATLGPPEPNPFHSPPGFGLQWLKRRPVVLAAAMVGVLVLVGIVVWRGSRRLPA